MTMMPSNSGGEQPREDDIGEQTHQLRGRIGRNRPAAGPDDKSFHLGWNTQCIAPGAYAVTPPTCTTDFRAETLRAIEAWPSVSWLRGMQAP
jgi:hypothetical protein